MYSCEKCGKEFEKMSSLGTHKGWCIRKNRKSDIRIGGMSGKKRPEHSKLLKELFKGSRNPMYGKDAWNKGIEMPWFREDNHPRWTGGCPEYCHDKARKLFEKDSCELCGRKEKEKYSNGVVKKLTMHCNGEYRNFNPENWMCVCSECHKTKLDAN